MKRRCVVLEQGTNTVDMHAECFPLVMLQNHLNYPVGKYYQSYFLIYLLIMLLQLSHFRPFTPLHPAHPLPPTFPSYSSCPWVILISSLASTFPTLFLPSPVYFPPIIYAFYSLYLPPPFPSHSPVDNPPCDLHFCGSVPVLVVCLVCSCFCFRCGH